MRSKNRKWSAKFHRVYAIVSSVAVLSAGMVALSPVAPASAAPINPGAIQARLINQKIYTGGGTSPSPGSERAPVAADCLRYSPTASTPPQSTGWVTAGNEAQAAHGYPVGGSCPNSLNNGIQSTLGITPLTVGTVNDGQQFPLLRVNHYNRPITGRAATHYGGEVQTRFTGFVGNPTVTFPWQLWETTNTASSHPSGSCPGGDSPGGCKDRVRLSTVVPNDFLVTADGKKYRLILSGFQQVSPTGSCPATPTNITPNAEWWTDENAQVSSCLYAYFQQIRELEVQKVVSGTALTDRTFAFNWSGSIVGSPWSAAPTSGSVTVGASASQATVTKKEIFRTDTVNITESTPDNPIWQLTGAQCFEKNAAGQEVPLTTGTATMSGRTLTISNVGEPLNANDPNIVCRFTNEHKSSSIQITKTVTGDGTGYAGGSTRTFPVLYSCTRTGLPAFNGTLNMPDGGASSPIPVPPGYNCTFTEVLTQQPGDFIDGSYEWQTYTITPSSLTTVAGTNHTVAVTNPYLQTLSSIRVNKVVTGSEYTGTGQDFAINYDCGVTSGQQTVAAGGNFTLDNLPVGTICTLSEEPPSNSLLPTGYEWAAPQWTGLTGGEITVVRGSIAEATVTNTPVPVYGKVSATKVVTGAGGVVINTTFPITIDCGAAGSWTENVFVGGTTTTPDVQVGTSCTVSEAAPTGSTNLIDDSYEWVGAPAPQTVTVTEKNQIVPVTVTNTTRRVYGSLTVEKLFTPPIDMPDPNMDFSGTWECTYGPDTRNGTWNLTAGNSTVVANDILLNSHCQVSENVPPGPSSDPSYYWQAPLLDPATGAVSVLSSNPNPKVTVTNRVQRTTGSFTIAKFAPGNGYVPGSEFPFTWSCTADGWEGASGTVDLASGDVFPGPSVTIPAGAECTVTEGANPAPATGYTWDRVDWTVGGVAVTPANPRQVDFTIPDEVEGAPQTIAVTATNISSMKYGSVAVTKVLDGGGYDGVTEFEVILVCDSIGSGTLSLKPGETKTFPNVPLGSNCTVSETPPTSGLIDDSYAWDGFTFDPETLTITAEDQVVQVTVTNKTKRVYGGVQVEKTLIAPDGVVDRVSEYSGTWSCQYGNDTPVTGTWTAEAGATTAVLSDQILVGSLCTATENSLAAPSSDPSYYWLTPVITDATVPKGGNAVVNVTNEVARNTSTVTVTKTLTGATAGYTGGTAENFTVNYECTHPQGIGEYRGSVNVAAGVAAKTLFANVPNGWTCEITEEEPSGNLHDASFDWNGITITPSTFVVGETASLNVEVSNDITRVYAPVTVTKTLVDPYGVADVDREFFGTWRCIYDGAGDRVEELGEWRTTSVSDPLLVDSDVLIGSNCTIEEVTDSGSAAANNDPSYLWDVPQYDNATVTAEGANLNVTNSLQRYLGSIEVIKQITGEVDGFIGGDEEVFQVDYTCTFPGNDTPLEGSVLLSRAGSKTITDLPTRWECEFSELYPNDTLLADASYQWGQYVIDPDTPRVIGGQIPPVTVTNPIVRNFQMVDIDKTVSSISQNADGTWTIVYEIRISNPLNAPSTYSLSDTLNFGGGLTPTSAEWTRAGLPDVHQWADLTQPAQLATDTPIGANGPPPTLYIDHIYTVTVTATVDEGVVGTTPALCGTDGQGNPSGGFLNLATVTVGDESATDDACDSPTIPDVDKTFVGATQNADTTWTVEYTLTVNNSTGKASVYNLTDTPGFPAAVTITGGSVVSDGVTPPVSLSGFTGGPIVTAQAIDAGATHTYTVKFIVEVPFLIDDDVLECSPTGGTGYGYFNTVTLKSGEDTREDSDCGDIPPSGVPSVAKNFVSATQQADGSWNVVYDITVTAHPTLATKYSLTDTLHFGAGVTVNSAAWTGTTSGDFPAGSTTATLATDRVLAAGTATEVYTVTVNATVPENGVGTPALDCEVGDGEEGTGFLNKATISWDQWSSTVEACGSPTIPDVDKKFESASQNADASWTVKYTLTVDNTGGHASVYDLTDTHGFPVGVTVTGGSVVSGADTPALSIDPFTGGSIVTGVAIDANATHTYTLEFVVEVSVGIDGELRECSPDGVSGHGFFNTVTLTSGGSSVSDDDCGPIEEGGTPTLSKAVISATQQTDGSWTVVYEVRVKANADYATKYTVTDNIRFGAGVTVNSAEWTGPTSGTFSGTTATLATDRVLAAGAADDVYTVTVNATVAAGGVGTPALDCEQQTGEEGTGFLNEATISSGGWEDVAEACDSPTTPDVAKTFVSATQNADGSWTVLYTLTVDNSTGKASVYSLSDSPGFPLGVTITGGSVVSGAGTPALSIDPYTGGSIVTGVAIDAGATHTYEVSFMVEVAYTISDDVTQCDADAGEEHGYFNTVTLTSGGETRNDDDCGPIDRGGVPSISKEVVSAVQQADGSWTVTYEVRVKADADYATKYTLTDNIRFGAGVTVNAAGWTGPTSGLFSGTSATLATDRVLAAGAADEVYTVIVNASVPAESVGTPDLDCEVGDGEEGTGFLNEATISSGGWEGGDDACTTPVLPTIEKTAIELVKHMVGGSWDGTWDAIYRIDVTNPATDGQQITYTLTDSPSLPAGVELVGQSVTSAAAGLPDGWNNDWNNGDSNVLIADRTTGAALESYTVTLNIKITAEISEGDRTCETGEGDDGGGVVNTGTISSGGDAWEDEDCLDIPKPRFDVDKMAQSVAEQADGTWMVTYVVVAKNTGDVALKYSLEDTLKFGAGLTPLSASWMSVGTGLSGSWTDPAVNPTASLVTDRVLEAGAEEQFVIMVHAEVDPAVIGTTEALCTTAEDGTKAAFLNQGTMTVDGKSVSDEACGEPVDNPRSYTLTKTSDPKPGTTVKPGDVITYTVSATNPGTYVYRGAVVTDDISGWTPYGALVPGSLKVSDGTLVTSATAFTWTLGDLQGGKTVTMTYQVKVNADAWSKTLVNVATGSGDVPPVKTEHPVGPKPLPPTGLPEGTLEMAQLALLLLLGGGVLVGVHAHRRRRA